MIKTLVKLALAGLIANAVWRVGSEYIAEFKFRDAVREAAVYDGRGDFDLRQHIAALAQQFDLPFDDETVTIERSGGRVMIAGWYNKPIEVLPGYLYVWRFAWNVAADLVRPGSGALEPKGEAGGR